MIDLEMVCGRIESFRTADMPDDPVVTGVFLDTDIDETTSEYAFIEGKFFPCPFELGKRYRITIEEAQP